MFMTALITTLVASAILALVDLIKPGPSLTNTVGSFIASMVFGTITMFLLFWIATPPFEGANWILIIGMALVWPVICFGAGDIIEYEKSWSNTFNALGASSAVGVIVVLALVFGAMIYDSWSIGQGGADKLAGLVKVEHAKEGTFPTTDPDHLLTVSESTAEYKADQALTSADDPTLNTLYDIDTEGFLQSVNNHMYYLYQLTAHGKQQKKTDYTVPGYIVIDAENQSAVPDIRTTNADGKKFAMRYVKDMGYEYSINRKVWGKYRDYYKGGLSLEVDDNWNPYYTTSVDKPALRWKQSVPEKFITLDPQSGNIAEYSLENDAKSDLPKVLSWVDRVYSKSAVTEMMTWYGRWGNKEKAPYKYVREGRGYRYEPAGDSEPTLVYDTTGHAVWQVLMRAKSSGDKAVNGIVLFDARSAKATWYPVPAGMTVQGTVKDSIKKAKTNTQHYEPEHLTLHKIYNQLTWVAPLIPEGDDDDENKSKTDAGLALAPAVNPGVNNVAVGANKQDALNKYSDLLTANTSEDDPEANANTTSIEGVIDRIADLPSGRVIILKDDTTHFYVQKVNDGTPELALARIGDKVTITFLDLGDDQPQRKMSRFDDLDLTLTK